MTFTEKLKILENLIHQDTERCLLEISAKAFTSSLFYPQLRALVNMFETSLQKKTTQSKLNNQAKQSLRPQIIIGFYSVIIMRSSVINIKHEHTSAIATKVDPQADSIYNSKLAIETLSKIYRGLDEADQTRAIICGLLLKIRGFNNYKMIAKDLTPLYISDQTMNLHFESLKHQCPNLLQIQLIKHKIQWAKYLRYKPVNLTSFQQLLDKKITNESQASFTQQTDLLTQLQEETTYVLKRFELISESSQAQKINLQALTTSIDGIYAKLLEKIKQTTVTIKKSAKGDQLQPEYDSRQELHKNYLKIFNSLLKIINVSISSLHLNWLRKIKWLYSFISNLFINFDIKGANFHESIAQEYSKILLMLVQIVSNYLLTFKSGLFPQDKLTQLTFTGEYSIYKLIECFLYNEYPFDQEEAIKYQNYQKQRKHHENKNKQHVIDIVNFNMKSLNINIHWDTMLIKVIPQLKNSILFGKTIVNLALYFILRYFQITNNYQEAAKLLLMIANAKNTGFTLDKNASLLIRRIKNCVYSDRKEIKQGIEYFCEDYFQEQLKYNKKRIQRMEDEEEAHSNRVGFFELCKTDSVHINNANQVAAGNFKKTESYDAIIQGWDNYDSVRDSIKEHSGEQLKESVNRQMNMFQSVDSDNNEMFYSINESKHQRMMEAIKSQKQVQGEVAEVGQKGEDNQILLPQF